MATSEFEGLTILSSNEKSDLVGTNSIGQVSRHNHWWATDFSSEKGQHSGDGASNIGAIGTFDIYGNEKELQVSNLHNGYEGKETVSGYTKKTGGEQNKAFGFFVDFYEKKSKIDNPRKFFISNPKLKKVR